MTAQAISVGTSALYYGTAAEIVALSANTGDVGFATDTQTEYTNYSTGGSGTDWVITRVSTNGTAHVADGFKPSSYSGNVTVTTTVSGQSEEVPSGAYRVRIRNIGATNYLLAAFGTSAGNAETNAANGVLVEVDTTEILGVPANATHLAYVADTNTVTANIVWGN